MSDRQPTRFNPCDPLARGVTLLEASAGTGKTYSITSLFVRLVIEHELKVEQILAVTFTQAATAELTSRIRKRLSEAHRVLHLAARHEPIPQDDDVLAYLATLAQKGDPTEWAERARKAVESFDRANITTIHGFCQSMLTQHALESQVPFGVTLIEDPAALVQEIVDDFWVREVSRAEPWEVQALATIGVELESMRRLARTAVDQWEATPVPAVAPERAERPDSTALVAALAQAAEAARQPHVRAEVEALQEALRARTGFVPSGWKAIPQSLESLAQGRVGARDLTTLGFLHRDSLRSQLPTEPLPPIVPPVTQLLATFAAWRPKASPWALALRSALVHEVRREHTRRTSERGVWTYDDLLRRLRDALDASQRPEVAATLREAIGRRFAAVLIDEFQDTDPVQWQIFETVFADRRHFLYLIGDPKQAIYGFRRADVMTYLEAGKKADFVYTLSDNYRSDGPLVEALNHLYAMRNPERVFAVEGIPYRPVVSKNDTRVAGPAGQSVPPVRVLWVPRSKKSTGRGRDFATATLNGGWVKANLPGWVAADIVRTLESGITILDKHGSPRALAPDDLAVLVLRNEQAVKVQDALRRAGVPAVVHGPRSVFETDEARELLRVLSAVLDPSRMQNVRAALLTRLLGLTAFELAQMEAQASTALEDRIDRLREWREVWHKRSFIEAFRRLTSDRVEALLGLEDGERRLANLLQLGELLHLAAAQKDLKPTGLVAWLERQLRRADKTDERQQVRLETDEPAVQVVTVHKAKGLEYAFVWCPYLWQKGDIESSGRRAGDFVFRGPDRMPHIEIGLDDRDPARRRAQALQVYGDQSERLRAFYVALTRAKHQVTLYGGAFWELAKSPLAYTLFSSVSANDADSLAREVSVLDGLRSRPDDELLRRLSDSLPARWFSVESAAPPAAPPNDQRYVAPVSDAKLEARLWPATRVLDTAWRRTSFSGLVHEAGGDQEERMQAASDEDRAANEDLFLPAHEAGDVLLADLPSGRAIGNCIHKILELADFTAPEALPELVAAELTHFAVDAAHVPSLASALANVLATPLDTAGLRLAELPRARRLPELGFVFPVAGGYAADHATFTHRALVRAFKTLGPPALASWLTRFEALGFSQLRGFLSGSLDLAFQSPRDGRWYVVDWKSNHLGRSARDYAQPRLRAAMDHHHYHLQYHLYSLALCRYLAARLPSFDIASDFGGIFYLFLRGMHPDHPPGTGVFHDRPSPALLAELDYLFKGERDEARALRQLELL